MNFIDLHTDMPLKLINRKTPVADFKRLPYEKYVQNAAFWFKDADLEPVKKYEQYLKVTNAYAQKNDINIIGDFTALDSGIFLSVENGGFLAEHPHFVERLSIDNIKIISLTWNEDNALAGGAKGNGTLTKKGKEIIKALNYYKIALDISHLNEASALRAIELAKYPLATHSNCRAVCKNFRNLSDEVLLKIKAKNGLVGICFYPKFLGGEDIFLSVKKHIEHLICLGMEKSISIGSDFDGGDMDSKLSAPEDVLSLYGYLLKNGVEKPLLDDIFYENAIAFFDRMCHNKV